MSCDYNDIIVPIDYIPEAFEYANRNLFHRWKMIGMQVSHNTVGGTTPVNTIITANSNDDNVSKDGNYKLLSLPPDSERIGALSGCLPIEEINQNNHIIGRGAYYFRHKSTAPSGDSAMYGIQGHCNSPGIDFGRGDTLGLRSANGYFNPSMIEDVTATPMYRGWGRRLGTEFCTCANSTHWHLAVFLQNQNTGRVTMGYNPDDEKYEGTDYICHNSRFNGRFNACFGDMGHPAGGYRSCEALQFAGVMNENEDGPCKIDFESFKSEFDSDRYVINQAITQLGVVVKLTSLPACNPLGYKFFHEDYNGMYNSSKNDGSVDLSYFAYPCERAVIRISNFCTAGVGFGPQSNVGTTAEKFFHSNTIEKHYDRWDPAEEGGREQENRYKIFDEVFSLPNFPYNIRVLSHHSRELYRYFRCVNFNDCIPGYENPMQVKYLTGGPSTGVPGGPRGCSCSHSGQDIEKYPIRPYNNFNYCPNNFTCEKSCT